MDSKTRIKDFINHNLPEWEKIDYAEFEKEIEFKKDFSELYRINNEEIIMISYTNISITGTDRPKPQLRVFLDEYKKPFYFAKKHQLRYYLFSIFTKEDEMARGLDKFNPKEYVISIETNLDNEGARRDLRSIYDYANENLKGRKFLKCTRSNYKAEINQASFIYIGSVDTPEKTTFENFVNIFDSRPYLNSTGDTVEDGSYKERERKSLQQIHYGAPGTGKSHGIDKDTNENNRIRTTFHPDYDYATFVGAYKPTVKKTDKYGLFGKDTVKMMLDDDTPVQEEIIVYKFIPQAFIKAYVEAWKRHADAECTDKDFYLVIEEINRGNCAQIFGDLFQLLDRTSEGFSSYAVETESDLQKFLKEDEEYKLDITLTEDIKNDNGKVIATKENVMNGKVLVLPPNLHIWATMNTSDQSLFPIDSAFKRRWDWVYKPIKYNNTEWKIVLNNEEVCKWTELQQTLNNLIYEATDSEDKMLGDWFVKADSMNEINEDKLVGKIIFYLWNDVAKVDAGKLFDLEIEKNGTKRKVVFSDFYNIDGKVDTVVVRAWLKDITVLKTENAEDKTPNEPEQ